MKYNPEKAAEYREKHRKEVNAYSRTWMKKWRDNHSKRAPRCPRCLFLLDTEYHRLHPCPQKQVDSLYIQRKMV